MGAFEKISKVFRKEQDSGHSVEMSKRCEDEARKAAEEIPKMIETAQERREKRLEELKVIAANFYDKNKQKYDNLLIVMQMTKIDLRSEFYAKKIKAHEFRDMLHNLENYIYAG